MPCNLFLFAACSLPALSQCIQCSFLARLVAVTTATKKEPPCNLRIWLLPAPFWRILAHSGGRNARIGQVATAKKEEQKAGTGRSTFSSRTECGLGLPLSRLLDSGSCGSDALHPLKTDDSAADCQTGRQRHERHERHAGRCDARACQRETK